MHSRFRQLPDSLTRHSGQGLRRGAHPFDDRDSRNPCYSVRSESMGSILDARRAGR
jgi:hypothetical protein